MPTNLLASDRHMGFGSVESVWRVITFLLWRFWRICVAAILIIILLYWMYGGVLILLVLLVTLVGALYHYQDSLLYYPEQPESARVFVQLPSSLGLPYEMAFLTTRDKVQIAAYFIKQPNHIMSQAPSLIYFHGNAGNIGHRLHNAQALYRHCGFNILLVEYRGYGKSQGSPSETGLYMDAEAAMEFLLARRDIDRRKIMVFGRSLGGAVAIYLAGSPAYVDKVLAVIVENTFTSIPHMAQLMIPGASSFPKICFKNKFLSFQHIRRVRAPTLFLSGVSDQLIPPTMMMELYQGSGASLKHIETFHGGTHNGTWTCFGYYEQINKFNAYVLHSRALASSTSAHPSPPSSSSLPVASGVANSSRTPNVPHPPPPVAAAAATQARAAAAGEEGWTDTTVWSNTNT